PTTLRVYACALAGYALLVWALYSGLFLFAVGRHRLVLRGLVVGGFVSAGTGLALTRTGPAWTASIGLAAGALVFALLSAREAFRVIDRIDYYAFAAY